ncbi:flagellar basal body rod protein FlgG [Rossellomorea vietnamensis]|uniref:Flagellar hook protein FlgE n=1 Tax=Rossellomorea vietnamensis TaxID=218284 RepID=A0A5D4NS28_9BACI|nr:flagellar basal body rod protein FlgG [Rossellomorea vietnamensis]TYS16278.1 flagellar basal body rod protein FlgG [Rossellomorea vietnamensis]
MLRSMYSGISGMKNFQTKLDVIGNNIANVNTFGFKKGRATFADLVNQNIQGAKASDGVIGGVNPKQIGLGSANSTIDTIHTQGSIQYTNRPLDLAISGDGFFVVSDGANDFYTRAGNFYLDGNGDLVNSDGLVVQPGINIPDDAQSFSIDPSGEVSYIDNAGALTNVGTLQVAKFANPGALEKQGGNLFAQTANSGIANIVAAGEDGTGKFIIGGLEMSNVDLSEEFTEMITAQRGFQANTKIITTSDEILQELVNLKR